MATILVVDDRAANRDFLVSLLGYGGNDLLQASDGAEALEIVRARSPDLVIADILMPTMDGYELVRHLREDPITNRIPVIFWTATYLEREAWALANSCGVSVVITKPSEPEVVLRAVAEALESTGRAGDATVGAEFQASHLRLLTDKLSQNETDLIATNDRLAAIVDLSLQLGSELELPQLIQKFDQCARQIIGARYSILTILDESGEHVKFSITGGLDEESASALRLQDSPAAVLKTVLEERQTVRLYNPPGDPTAFGLAGCAPPVCAWLGAPISSPNKVYGYLALINKIGLEEFTAADEHVAAMLAAQLGRIYQNHALYKDALDHSAALSREITARAETERALAQRARLSMLVAEVGASLIRDSLPEISRLCAQSLVRNLDASIARIWMMGRSGSVLELMASEGPCSTWDEPAGSERSGKINVGLIALERTPYHTDNLLRDPRFGPQEWYRAKGIVSYAGWPLLVGEQLVGVAEIFTDRAIDSTSMEALGSAAQEIALGTERWWLQEQFRLAQNRLHHVIVSSPAVLFTAAVSADEILGITWVSDNLFEVLGYSPESALGLGLFESGIHPEDAPVAMSRLKEDLFTFNHSMQEYRFRNATGVYLWTRCEIRLIRNEGGWPLEAVGTWTDVTRSKLAELEQAKLQEQFQHAQKLESVARLAGGLAHDFNNLLTVINGYGDLLLQQLPPATPASYMAKEIRTAGDRAAALSGRLLVLSRKNVIKAVAVNLNDIIRELEGLLRGVLSAGIRLETVLSPSLGRVMTDAGQMHQVLMNLALNACDAMPDGGTLLIESANVDLDGRFLAESDIEPGSYVELRVSDTGLGMSQDVMAHLFEPFFTTKPPGSGTGLGLATAYSIVKQSGGSISFYSDPGKGTSCRIYLPRIISEHSAPALAETQDQVLRGDETILVVEDQEQLRRMVVGVLESFGYSVHSAADPKAALSFCQRYDKPIRLLLSDIVMPGMSGRELAHILKPLRPAMDVIYMSGYSSRAMIERDELDASSLYIAKPFSSRALGTKIREALGPATVPGTVILVDRDEITRRLLSKLLISVGYRVLGAGDRVLDEWDASEIDLLIGDVTVFHQEHAEAFDRLRQARPDVKIIAMGEPGELRRFASHVEAQALLAKPIVPEELFQTVARVLLSKTATPDG